MSDDGKCPPIRGHSKRYRQTVGSVDCSLIQVRMTASRVEYNKAIEA